MHLIRRYPSHHIHPDYRETSGTEAARGKGGWFVGTYLIYLTT
jgi:hypothetical protein